MANSGEGGFDKARIGTRDGNRSVQYAGRALHHHPHDRGPGRRGRGEVRPGRQARQGRPAPGQEGLGAGGAPARLRARLRAGLAAGQPQPLLHRRREAHAGELAAPQPRGQLRPQVRGHHTGSSSCAWAGSTRGPTACTSPTAAGARAPPSAWTRSTRACRWPRSCPTVHDLLVEEGVRDLVEVSVDGGVQNGEQALKLALLGADRIGFGTSRARVHRLLDAPPVPPRGPAARRHHGHAPARAAPPAWPPRTPCTWPASRARAGTSRPTCFRWPARCASCWRSWACAAWPRSWAGATCWRRSRISPGKAALIDVSRLVSAPPQRVPRAATSRSSRRSTRPPPRVREEEAAERAIAGELAEVAQRLNNTDRCVGVAAAGRRRAALRRRWACPTGRLVMRHKGAAGHFYAAYSLKGMEFHMQGLVADSASSAAYGGKVVIVPENGNGNGRTLTLAGNTFGYGARAGRAYIRGPRREPLRHLPPQEPRRRRAAHRGRGRRGQRLPVHDGRRGPGARAAPGSTWARG